MTVSKRLTRNLGPAPLWAWLVVALIGAYLVYRHHSSTAAAATYNSTPAAATSAGTSAGAGASGSGADSGLLTALGTNTASLDSLLGAVQQQQPAAVSSSSSTLAAASSVDATATPASAGIATTENTNPYAFPAIISGGQTNAMLPADQQVPGLPPNAYVIGGPSQVAPPQFLSFKQASDPLFGPTISGPTPTPVQPAPTVAPTVYQPGTIVPVGTAQVA